MENALAMKLKGTTSFDTIERKSKNKKDNGALQFETPLNEKGHAMSLGMWRKFVRTNLRHMKSQLKQLKRLMQRKNI